MHERYSIAHIPCVWFDQWQMWRGAVWHVKTTGFYKFRNNKFAKLLWGLMEITALLAGCEGVPLCPPPLHQDLDLVLVFDACMH